ncbi:glycoprotein endo-alpha-1,2-mannosidase-like [Chelonus insularis]|uniref:glycoprotein endo-alpha-1,2-mannosidase-like n=1 Tax=Chelonus insularis TaxID=460826 RepID=UPI00158A28AB|nr:glycoprotein endo-alpha-1,2-mannosidase-like [Chelonus insularis]XP_034940138.1 glycoprotein endo-alpha-1,2-mannosidase-like [Chelonus insularis]XP_034940139.1 glycoprotein endo-alpha-1,2-mannosidase-like [Chelonus insularis]
MMLGSFVSAVSLRRCFYLSSMVFILSTLMAMMIIVKLTPLESTKCNSANADETTARIEWSSAIPIGSIAHNRYSDNNGSLFINSQLNSNNESQREYRDDKFSDIRINTNKNNMQIKVPDLSWKMRNKVLPLLSQKNAKDFDVNYHVHIFYYPWYRSLSYDGYWKHWNHNYIPNWKKNDKKVYPVGTHQPPADIGTNFYPSLGCYSSNDPQVIDLHMKQLKETGVGVLVVSWIPPNLPDSTDSLMADLLDAAHRYSLKIAPHIEPYPGRNPINLIDHIKYLFERYASHPALHRVKKPKTGVLLPMIYIYDSYLFPPSAWWELLSERGNLTLRRTEFDAVYIGLLVDSQHRSQIKKSHFDGFYTYFAVNGFSYGSTWKNWKDLNKFANDNDLLFIPSVGPGYIDTQVRPWNAENIRYRRHGQYYEVAWKSAMNSGANIVSITSFNEWHEGTQIEPAKPVSNKDFTYLDYEPEGPNFYLNLTKWWIQQFSYKTFNSN